MTARAARVAHCAVKSTDTDQAHALKPDKQAFERRRNFRKKQERSGKLKVLVHKIAAESILFPSRLIKRCRTYASVHLPLCLTGTIYEIVPLMSRRLRSLGSSGSLSRPCRNFGAVARVTTLTHDPWSSDFDDFWFRPAPRQLLDTLFDLVSPFQMFSHASRLKVRVVLTHRHHLCSFAPFES